MTRFLQSLDLSINKPFKNYMYHKFNEWKIANDFKFKPNENNIIDWIVSVWNDDKLITKEMIINSFKYTGISNNLDGSEDHLIKWSYEVLASEEMNNRIDKSDDLSDEEEIHNQNNCIFEEPKVNEDESAESLEVSEDSEDSDIEIDN